jgi:hypothetical protein
MRLPEVHGPSHENTLSAIGDLAKIYVEAKLYTEAEVMYKETEAQGEERLCLTKEAHGYSHANTLEAIRWVGGDALSSL